jgi:hypothetical protein
MDVTLRFWLGVGLALAALLGTAAPVAARDVPRDFYGTVLDGDVLGAPTAVLAQQWPRMASSGAETVRVVFSWSLAQPVARGPIDFSATDALVAGAAGHGLDVLPVVMYTPGWARADPTAVASPPARNADYTAYLTALVGRYGPDGSFWSAHPELPARPLRAWQIWNEPQLGYQWSTPGYVSGYGALLRDAYRALKSADPGCKVVLAGATNLSWKVFRRLYAKGGIRGFFDVAAVHPYTMEPANVLRILRLVRGVLRRHGDGDVPIWVTELGFPASRGRVPSTNPLQTTPDAAARRLTSAYSLLARHRAQLLVERVYWYTWVSSYSGTNLFNFAGLFRLDGFGSVAAQPPAAAYVRSARRHEGCRKTAAGLCA